MVNININQLNCYPIEINRKKKLQNKQEFQIDNLIFFEEKELIGAPTNLIKLVKEKNKKILEQKNKITELSKKAFYDNLTGLLNRHGIDVSLEKKFKKTDLISIVLIDLDNLKQINTHSYKNGDKAIKIVAYNLKKFFGKNKSKKIIARLGGDEFLVISNNKDKDQFINTISKINKTLSDISCKLNSFNISITTSFKINTKKEEIINTIKVLHKNITRKKKLKK